MIEALKRAVELAQQLPEQEQPSLAQLMLDEMQAAAWALVQRVRGLLGDLARVEQARAAWQREAQGG